MCYHQIDTFLSAKISEDTGILMEYALYVLQYAKRHLSGQNDI